MTAVDQPNTSTPFIAVIGPISRQRSAGTTSPYPSVDADHIADHETAVRYPPELEANRCSRIVRQSMRKRVTSQRERWLANLRILEVDEVKSIPYVPVSHPFVERLIGT